MTIQVLMPALSPTMTEGKLARWLKAEGDAVEPGDVIAEIETDKATMEVEAVDEGKLGKILIAEGTDGVKVNTPIAVILEEGEDASAIDDAAAAPEPSPSAEAQPKGEGEEKPAGKDKAPAAPEKKEKAAPPPEAAAKPEQKREQRKDGERIFASPLARRLAEQAGLDLAQLSGSGPHGRIVKRDVEKAEKEGISRPPAKEAARDEAAAAPPAAPAEGVPYHDVPHSSMRKVIAQRLSASKREIPHYYLTIDCDVEDLLALRSEFNAKAPEGEGGYKLSVNDFVVRAVALALRKHPELNAAWTDEALRLYETADVCVAVATPNGLITPVVRNADSKGLAAISNEVRQLAKRAQEGKLKPEEYQGGGFTVSNLGMYGITEFAAIINPPQTGLLAVGAAEQRPVVKDGALSVATMMTCTLSADHRAVDGAMGAEFLATLKGLIEDPITMLL